MTGGRASSRLTISKSGVLARGGNSFGLLRLLLAAFVIVSHTYSIGGFGQEPLVALSHGTTTLGTVAVYGFFALSGVLVGMSAENSDTPKYLWHRARRILPAFWVCLVVSAFGFGAYIAWLQRLPLTSITQPGTASARTFVVNNIGLGIQQYPVGTVLKQLPYPGAMNGSLWSLAYEATCYLIVLAFVRAWIASQRRDLVVASAFGASVFVAFAARVSVSSPGFASILQVPLLGTLNPALLYPLWAVFMAGTALALLRDRIPFSPLLTAIAILACVVSIPLGWFEPAGALAMPYALIGIGYYLPLGCRSVGIRSDFSYGLFLYGFPVGQALVAAQPNLWRAWSLTLATLSVTFAFAAASWYGVERFFLRPPLRRARRQPSATPSPEAVTTSPIELDSATVVARSTG